MVPGQSQPLRTGEGALNSGLREWTKGKKKIPGHMLVIRLQSCVFSGHIFVEIFSFQFNRCLVESKCFTPHQLSFCIMPTSQYQRQKPQPQKPSPHSYQLRQVCSHPSVRGEPKRKEQKGLQGGLNRHNAPPKQGTYLSSFTPQLTPHRDTEGEKKR